MPLLTEALTQLAKEKPDQPIEFVAKYLLDHNPEKSWRILDILSSEKTFAVIWMIIFLLKFGNSQDSI